MSNPNRFGVNSINEIDHLIEDSTPSATIKTKKSIWKQFVEFCMKRNYRLSDSTKTEELASILKDWAFNMRKIDGKEYKENVVKTMWNVTAKMLQEKYHTEYNRDIDPFSSIIFKSARDARNSKRRLLQVQPEKRKLSSTALEKDEFKNMINLWDENTPEGLQKKFFLIASFELAWRGGEGAACLVHYFKEEVDNEGAVTGRIEYNPIFSKTNQGGARKCADSKWLISNNENINNCPLRLFKKLMEKRTTHIKTDRLFLTVNPSWNQRQTSGWYKNMPIGKNEISKWTNTSAKLSGLDTKNKKITNHSSRATAVSQLAKSGVDEQQLLKISGHASAHSIKPYLQLDKEHHATIVNQMRNSTANIATTSHNSKSSNKNNVSNVYNNCTFTCTNLYMNQ